jgi:alkylation response protein AidB-like acyl-CoA dehydrogenase
MLLVDFELSEDQLALQEAARDLLDGYADHDHVRAHIASGEPYDVGLWRAMAEQGWLGVTLPEDAGGLGAGWVEAAVLLEVVGRHTAPAPFLPSLLALDVLVASDPAPGDQRDDWVGGLAAGELIGCTGWSHDPSALVATGSGADWTVSGRLGPVEGAAVADLGVVVASDAVFAVKLAADDRPPREPAMDVTRALSWLSFDRAPAVRLGGADLAAGLLDRGAVGASAEMLGGSGRVLEMAVQYAKDRIQFDQPIGSFQAIKHRCADMVVDVEGMRSSTWYAAWALSAGEPDTSIAASTAKVWSSDAAKRVMASGLQVHGGIGFTWEHDLHLYLKRSQFDRISFGDAVFHRQRLGGLLRERLADASGIF